MDRKPLKVFVFTALALPLAGCGYGTSQDVIESKQAAQLAYDEARQKLASKDFASAKPLLDQAIDSGKLYVDVMATAYVSRAICSAAAGDYEAAHADLDEMEKASSPESVGEFWLG
jgi:Tfp pilus assembly protein PilF